MSESDPLLPFIRDVSAGRWYDGRLYGLQTGFPHLMQISLIIVMRINSDGSLARHINCRVVVLGRSAP